MGCEWQIRIGMSMQRGHEVVCELKGVYLAFADCGKIFDENI